MFRDVVISVVVALLVGGSVKYLGGCAPDRARAIRTLEQAGYTNVRLGLYPFFECPDGAYFNIEFEGTGPTGKPAQGAVCCGLALSCYVMPGAR